MTRMVGLGFISTNLLGQAEKPAAVADGAADADVAHKVTEQTKINPAQSDALEA